MNLPHEACVSGIRVVELFGRKRQRSYPLEGIFVQGQPAGGNGGPGVGHQRLRLTVRRCYCRHVDSDTLSVGLAGGFGRSFFCPRGVPLLKGVSLQLVITHKSRIQWQNLKVHYRVMHLPDSIGVDSRATAICLSAHTYIRKNYNYCKNYN